MLATVVALHLARVGKRLLQTHHSILSLYSYFSQIWLYGNWMLRPGKTAYLNHCLNVPSKDLLIHSVHAHWLKRLMYVPLPPALSRFPGAVESSPLLSLWGLDRVSTECHTPAGC